MRDLKFRAWDRHSSMCKVHGIDKQSVYIDEGDTIEGYCIDGFIIMQSTCLKDMNGVEIFEGDIVSLCTDGEFNNTEITFTVDRDFNGWEITPQHIEDGSFVIGNVHENPSLMKQGEE